METLLSMIWYPITVATQSYYMKQSILTHLDKTGTLEDIGFKLHDFGFRGVSSKETAGIGGVAHLVNFVGTDNMAALQIAKKYYNSKCAGFSIPASEHSTITSYGKDNELDAFRNMLQQYPTGLVACVSDSYDIYNACENLWGEKLHDEIMARDGTLVIRPDSGNPIEVVPKCLDILGDKFGYTENTKGYKVLNDHVRMFQGDGINRNSINDILQVLTDNKWSADNIAFGSGGALLQQLNRDTNMFAIKCSNATINGIERDVYKSPITSIAKESKRGRFTGLTEVFKDGEILVEYTLDEIRERINNDR
jgi:nicotinamide phosphoribosyltransferase